MLKDLLFEVEEDTNSNIASIDDEYEWKWPDVEHMFNMKFNREGDSIFLLKNPSMKVYKLKSGPFVVEEPIENHEKPDFKKGIVNPIKPIGMDLFKKSKQIKKYTFPSFVKLIDFFDKYHQEII